MHRIQKVIGSAVVLSVMALLPLSASASTANLAASSGIVINPNGIVRVIGANVTSVSNGVVDAALSLGNTVLDFVVDTSASTTIKADSSANASTTAIAVGDKVGFVGLLTSSASNTLTVAASKIRDLTNDPLKQVASTTKEHGKHTGIKAGLNIFAGFHFGKIM